MPNAPRVHAYIDETGDRGASSSSSPIFGMAAILLDDMGAVNVREAIRSLRADFRVPNSSVMSWKHHVKTHDRYIRREADRDERVPFGLEQGLRWVSAQSYAESQAADLYGGFLKSATWPAGEFGYVEPAYLLKVWPQIRKRESCAVPMGIKSMPRNELVQENAWFPCLSCGNESGSSRASKGRST